MKKVCKYCGEKQNISDFHIKKWREGKCIRSAKCKYCMKKHRQENPEHAKKSYERGKKWREKRLSVNVCNLLQYLKLHPCVDCGEDD